MQKLSEIKRAIIGELDNKYNQYEELGEGSSSMVYLTSPIDDE